MKNRRYWLTGSAAAVAALAGCSSPPQISDYAGQKPEFDLKTYFTGTVDGGGFSQTAQAAWSSALWCS